MVAFSPVRRQQHTDDRSSHVSRKQAEDAKVDWERAVEEYNRLSHGENLPQISKQLRECEQSLRRLQADIDGDQDILRSLNQHKDEFERSRYETEQLEQQRSRYCFHKN